MPVVQWSSITLPLDELRPIGGLLTVRFPRGPSAAPFAAQSKQSIAVPRTASPQIRGSLPGGVLRFDALVPQQCIHGEQTAHSPLLRAGARRANLTAHVPFPVDTEREACLGSANGADVVPVER
jgi:hypothetical protein